MVKNLVEYLTRCDDAYYNSSNPIVNDSTYDALVETLRRLDPHNEYLNKVGARAKSNKVGRLIPMGTLSKYHKDEEILKWIESEGGEILISPKYDGFAVELIYQRGKLVSASTRGDGHVGENVLSAMMRVQSVPIVLPTYTNDLVIVRGEAIIPLMHHDHVKELGYTAMRNAVPGIVRSNRADALWYVDFVAYEFIDGNTDRVSQRDNYVGTFIVEDYRSYDISDFEDIRRRREELRSEDYYYELDGVVLKTRFIKDDDMMNPNHMISWKYKSSRETTVLRGVDYQMGVSGYFTPSAIFDPVEFQGATLTRASLGNITRMKNEFKGLTIGSIIEVSRRGDIIPYCEELIYTNEDGESVDYPVKCPHCGEFLTCEDKEPHCSNKSCPEKLRLQIAQYVKTIGIKGIGDKLVTELIKSGIIRTLEDIYKLNPDEILNLPRFGQSAVDKWVDLQKRQLTTLELLTAYPFLDLGKKVWETVLSKFEFSEVLELTEEDLVNANLKGIGESKIKSIVSQVSEGRDELRILYSYAVLK